MPRSSPRFVGVVPCAGASRRMGRSKALLELEGETFVGRVVRALLRGGCHGAVVVVPQGEDEAAAAAEAAGARVLTNPDPGEGPITSLRLALAALPDTVDGIAYLPVDHPLVQAATVALLLREAESSGASLTLPTRRSKRGHPALFRRELFPELLDPALEGGARVVVHRHLPDARLVDVEDPGVVADIDTPEAYAALGGATP